MIPDLCQAMVFINDFPGIHGQFRCDDLVVAEAYAETRDTVRRDRGDSGTSHRHDPGLGKRTQDACVTGRSFRVFRQPAWGSPDPHKITNSENVYLIINQPVSASISNCRVLPGSTSRILIYRKQKYFLRYIIKIILCRIRADLHDKGLCRFRGSPV